MSGLKKAVVVRIAGNPSNPVCLIWNNKMNFNIITTLYTGHFMSAKKCPTCILPKYRALFLEIFCESKPNQSLKKCPI